MRTVITHFFNEEFLLPHWLGHHRELFDHGILINNRSTDNSVDVCRDLAPKSWKVVDSVNDVFDAGLCDLEVMWHEKDVKGWKVALNVTEFFVCPGLADLERQCLQKDFLGLRLNGAIMVDVEPEVLTSLDRNLVLQKHHGILESDFDFPGHQLPWMQRPLRSRLYHRAPIGFYHPGRHESFLGGVAAVKDTAWCLWYGFSPWQAPFIERKLQIQTTIASYNKKMKLGLQHLVTRDDLEARRQFLLPYATDLSGTFSYKKL